MVKRVRAIEKALGCPTKMVCGSEFSTMYKLRKVVVTTKRVEAGHVLAKDDLAIKVADPPGGLDGSLIYSALGKRLKVSMNADEPLMPDSMWDINDY